MMHGASFNVKQRLSQFGKTSGGVEGLAKRRAGTYFLITKEK